jgi:hypothetical protein
VPLPDFRISSVSLRVINGLVRGPLLLILLLAFCAPICPVIGSAFPDIEGSCNYIMKLIHRLQTDKLKSVTVKESAQTEFNQWVQGRIQEMALLEIVSPGVSASSLFILPLPQAANSKYVLLIASSRIYR